MIVPFPLPHAALVVTRTPACTTSTSRVSATHVPLSVGVAIGEASPTSPTSNSATKMVHFKSGREAAKPRRSCSSAVLTTAQRCLGIVVRKRSALSLPFRARRAAAHLVTILVMQWPPLTSRPQNTQVQKVNLFETLETFLETKVLFLQSNMISGLRSAALKALKRRGGMVSSLIVTTRGAQKQ